MAITSSIVALAWGRHMPAKLLSSADGQANRPHAPSVEPIGVPPTPAQETNPLTPEPIRNTATPMAGSYLLGNPANLRKAEGADPRSSGQRTESRRPAAQIKGHTPRAGRLSASDF
jgi:hypothetical protein